MMTNSNCSFLTRSITMKHHLTIILLTSILFSCGDSSPNDCEFIGEWCSFGLIDNETCDGLSNITFESSGEFVLTTVGATTGVETEWSTDDCQIISITGDDGQGGNPQVFRLEIISIVEDTM